MSDSIKKSFDWSIDEGTANKYLLQPYSSHLCNLYNQLGLGACITFLGRRFVGVHARFSVGGGLVVWVCTNAMKVNQQ